MRFYRNPHRLQGRRFIQFRQRMYYSEAGNFNGLNIFLLTMFGGGGGGGRGFPIAESLLEPPKNTPGQAGAPGGQVTVNIYMQLNSLLEPGVGGNKGNSGIYKLSGHTARYAAYDGYSGASTTVWIGNSAIVYTAPGGSLGSGAWQDWWPTVTVKESSWNPTPAVRPLGQGGHGQNPALPSDFGTDGMIGGIEIKYGA